MGFVFGPVDLAVFQVGQVDSQDRRVLIDEGGFGVFAPGIGC